MTNQNPRRPDDPVQDPGGEELEAGGQDSSSIEGSIELADLRRNFHSLTVAMRELLEVRPLANLESGEISPDQLRVLRLVFYNQGSRVGQVAEGLGIKPSSASLILDRLEVRGYIARYNDSTDRRITRLKPTEAGERIFEEAEGLIEERFERALRGFDRPKVAEFNQLLGDFVRGMMEGETLFASLCFHCGIHVTGHCVLDQKYEHCPYLNRITASRE